MISFGTGAPPPLLEGGLRRGEGNSSKACLRIVFRDFSQLDRFRMVLDYKLISDNVFAKLRRNQTLHLATNYQVRLTNS